MSSFFSSFDSCLFVEDEFLYLPLLCDEKGTDIASSKKMTITRDGRTLVKTLHLPSLIDTFPQLEKQEYERIKDEYLTQALSKKIRHDQIDALLESILFEVLPHFVKLPKGKTQEGIVDYLVGQVEIPKQYYTRAETASNIEELQTILKRTSNPQKQKLPDGFVSQKNLNTWLLSALQEKVMNEEKEKTSAALSQAEKLVQTAKNRTALLFYVKEKGLEISDFCVKPEPRSPYDDSSYMVSIKTGKYALKEFNDTKYVYVFPSCSVATRVSRSLASRPYILESYKHPFLSSTSPFQPICVRKGVGELPPKPQNIIDILEIGLNTMFYGYTNAVDFNGYHRLNGARSLGSYTVSFDNLRVLRTDKQIASREIEVKNDFI